MDVEGYKTKLTKGNTYWMAKLSKVVYEKDRDGGPDVEVITRMLHEWDDRFINVVSANKNSAQAIFVEHEDWVAMVFRGTDEPADWLDNLAIRSETTPFGTFHCGFYRSLEDVWDKIYKAYSDSQAKAVKPLFLTGHSLGGAMATVAAAKFIYMDRPFTSVYTFGQPRAVNRETARLMNLEAGKRYFRFQNNMDVVSRIPARLAGYSHTGQNLYITEEGDIESDPGFWFKFVDRVTDIVSQIDDLKGQFSELVGDHSIDKYLDGIENSGSWNRL